jgi:8-oxo-dGTP diphosphatase
VRKVVGAVILRGRKVFLLRKRARRLGNFWLFPGGVIEDGETPEKGLLRELKEELNCDVVSGSMEKIGEFEGPGVPSEPCVHLTCFLVKLRGCPQLNLEHDDCAYVGSDEAWRYKITGATRLCLEALKKKGLW